MMPYFHAPRVPKGSCVALLVNWIDGQPRVGQHAVYTILLWGTRWVGRSMQSGGMKYTLRPDSNSQTDGQQEVVTVYSVLQRGVS